MNKIQTLLILSALFMASTVANADDDTTTPTIGGSIFGGGRMAAVSNTATQADGYDNSVTCTTDIYACTITGGVYGGNDITGTVASGTTASAKVTVHDCNSDAITSINEVYGGGNGYYKYKVGTADPIAIGGITEANKSTAVASGTTITVLDSDGNEVTSFTTSAETTYGGLLPTLATTSVTIGVDKDTCNVYIGEVYGGAKNAYVTTASSVTINSGTMTKVFAGNNYGGSIAASSITVNATKLQATNPTTAADFKALTWDKVGSITFTDGVASTDGYGIGEAYGGGNAVDVTGNANVTVNGGYITTLFGGNNLADMAGVPAITFGTTNNIYINTIYGGGNAGDMKGNNGILMDTSPYFNTTLFASPYTADKVPVFCATDIQLNSNTLYVNDVYGGCKSANVDNSTFVHVNVADAGGFIGTVYAGCDIAGSVGYNPGNYADETSVTFTKYDHSTTEALTYKGPMKNTGSNIVMSAGTVENIFGGGNGAEYAAYKTAGGAKDEPWTVSTTLGLYAGTVTGNIYGGGNMASIGHVLTEAKTYYTTSLNSGDILRMNSYLCMGKADNAATGQFTVNGTVYGGGRMANILGTMDIYVKDGVNITTLYASNDIAGKVQGDNRGKMLGGYTSVGTVLRAEGITDATSAGPTVSFKGDALTSSNAQVYVRIEDGANITTLFGGGNGDYTYSDPASGVVTITDNGVTLGTVTASSAAEAKPKQVATWLDVRGKVGLVYGGGNAADINDTHVCLYGPAVVGTADVKGAVYGGCKSANVTHATSVYMASDGTNKPTVNGSLFGGCDISGNVGDCDADCDATNVHLTAEPTDATVPGYAYVNITAGTVTGRVFGGGNGLEDATGTAYYTGTPTVSGTKPADVFTYPEGSTYAGKQLPVCENTYVIVKNATVGSTTGSDTHTCFGGGQGAGTKVMHNVFMNLGVDDADVSSTVNGTLYGGSYAGFVNSTCSDVTQTTLLGDGTNTKILGDVYGGSYGNYVRGAINLNVSSVLVGVSDDADAFVYAGNNNAGQPECTATVNYSGDQCNVSLYGGGNKAPFYGTTRLTFTKGDIGYLYGGGNQAPVYGNTIVEVLGGHVCHDVYGGGNNGAVLVNEAGSGHNSYGTSYGGNTLVIVRDDCLQSDGSVSRDNATFYSTYFGNNDPDADAKQLYVLAPLSTKTTVTIDGNVYGGGNNADVSGKATVLIGNK